MKTKGMNTKILLVSFLVFSLLLWGCQKRSTVLDGLTFEQLCRQNKDQWMEMEPIREGKMLSTEKCFGCMIGENHFCTVQEYSDYILTLPEFTRN